MTAATLLMSTGSDEAHALSEPTANTAISEAVRNLKNFFEKTDIFVFLSYTP
jgi:hypothetical protein